MNWKALSDIVYYNLLKRAQIIIVILGLIVAILVYVDAQKYGIGVNTISATVITTCQGNNDCFEECNRCVSAPLGTNCPANTSISCSCVNSTCEVT